jgi:hypothetical protein
MKTKVTEKGLVIPKHLLVFKYPGGCTGYEGR